MGLKREERCERRELRKSATCLANSPLFSKRLSFQPNEQILRDSHSLRIFSFVSRLPTNRTRRAFAWKGIPLLGGCSLFLFRFYANATFILQSFNRVQNLRNGVADLSMEVSTNRLRRLLARLLHREPLSVIRFHVVAPDPGISACTRQSGRTSSTVVPRFVVAETQTSRSFRSKIN